MTATARASTLLTEVERQDKYLSHLPSGYNFPLFDGRLAVESQRKSGYKDTARAAREIVDNAVEAGATNVWIVLDRPADSDRAKRERRDAVANVAFIDDGPGMRPQMIRAALAWGGGTHGKEPGRIGRFGFGLPNSSINQTRRVEVYSKTEDAMGWSVAALDINEGKVPEHGMVLIDAEKEGVQLPAFVDAYLKQKGIKLTSGTVVVWVRPDRLTYRTSSMLAKLLREDFGATYRYLLKEFALYVDDQPTMKLDPLFLMKDGMFYREPDEDGARCTFEKTLTVKYFRDEITGAPHLELLTTKAELAEARKQANVTIGAIKVRVARFPYGFAVGKNDATKKPIDEHSKKRFAIRRARRGMSFVRGDREIDTVQVFPAESSLGDWPLLQSYAYHWGVEAAFQSELDEVFAVGHDKQSVRPIEDFWRVLHEARVDEALHAEQAHQREVRHKERLNAAKDEIANTNGGAAIEAAGLAADAMGPLHLPAPDPNADKKQKDEARDRVERSARDLAQRENIAEDEALKAIEAEAAQKRYGVAFFDSEGGPFFRPDLGNGLQKIALINRKHPFFEVFYAPLAARRDAAAVGAIQVLLIGLADAELQATGAAKSIIQHLREDRLSGFLKVGLARLDEISPAVSAVPAGEEEEEQDGADAEE